MKLLVTGGRGQLGRALVTRGAVDVEIDICDPDAVDRALADGAFTAVINAAAFTAVDRAQTERSRAYAINRDGAGIVARACAQRGVRMLHISTDYVFDGQATRPYCEDDPMAPLQVYGESKAEGEHAVHEAGGHVVRTSWLFGMGGPSFVHSILARATSERVLRVVADQHGCPTFADDLADALLALAARPTLAATYHFAGDGPTTWHGFACAIVDEARRHGPIACEAIEAITTADYPTPARRPAYSVLDTSRARALGIVPPSWRDGLARVVAEAQR